MLTEIESRDPGTIGLMTHPTARIDLRSDTVTKPTPEMWKAMNRADVGDDVYGEDRTVNRLQAEMAERCGFEAGLIFPSGTMSNLAAIATHANRGTNLIVPEGSHIYEHEMAGVSTFTGVVPVIVPAPRGAPEVSEISAALSRSGNLPRSGVIALENTHNRAGGTVLPIERQQALISVAREHNVSVHLDGARAFNAAVALKTSIENVCQGFDSVSICLSKGLGAPIGTVLLGSKQFIEKAHWYRRMAGGGMRQAGVFAAAGLVAINQMVDRLVLDHERARILAEGIAPLPGVEIDLSSVETNLIYFSVPDALALRAELELQGIACKATSADRIRMVVHHHITDEAVGETVRAVSRALKLFPARR